MKYLDHLEEWFIATLMGGATVLIFAAVLHRYLSGYPIPYLQDWLLSWRFSWAQELCIYLFVWMAKFGAAYGVRIGIHVGVDVLLNKLPAPLQNNVILLGLCAGVLFTGIVAALGGSFVWENGAHYAFVNALGLPLNELFAGPTTPDLEWQTWVVYSAIPLGSALMCFRFAQAAAQFARTGSLAKHDHGHVDGLDQADNGLAAMGHSSMGHKSMGSQS